MLPAWNFIDEFFSWLKNTRQTSLIYGESYWAFQIHRNLCQNSTESRKKIGEGATMRQLMEYRSKPL